MGFNSESVQGCRCFAQVCSLLFQGQNQWLPSPPFNVSPPSYRSIDASPYLHFEALLANWNCQGSINYCSLCYFATSLSTLNFENALGKDGCIQLIVLPVWFFMQEFFCWPEKPIMLTNSSSVNSLEPLRQPGFRMSNLRTKANPGKAMLMASGYCQQFSIEVSCEPNRVWQQKAIGLKQV